MSVLSVRVALTMMLALACLSVATAARAELFELIKPDPPPIDGLRDDFGFSVSIDGDTAIVGMPGEDYLMRNGGQGAAHVFKRQGNAWVPQAKLIPPGNHAQQFAHQAGYDVAISGNTAILGTFQLGKSAYVYVREGDSWSYQGALTKSDLKNGTLFGRRVAISGDIAVVAEEFDADTLAGSAVHVYERNGNSWHLASSLKASDAAPYDYFGNSIAVQDGTIVVGSNRGAYIYQRDGGVWSEQAKLAPLSGDSDTLLGRAVSMDGNRLVVGSWDNEVFVFERNDATWAETAHLTRDDAAPLSAFGLSLSLSGDGLLVSDPQYDEVYYYRYDGSDWRQTLSFQELPSRRFGTEVALSGTNAIAGTLSDQAFVFQVPEPAGLALAGIALAALAVRGRRGVQPRHEPQNSV